MIELHRAFMTPVEIEKIFRDEAGQGAGHADPPRRRFRSRGGRVAGCIRGGAGRGGQPLALPSNPRAWLVNVGRNKAIDRVSRNIAFRGKQQELTHEILLNASAPCETADGGLDDDMLRLIFTCCHPSFAADVQVALTLRTVCGLTTAAGRARVSRQRRCDGAAPVARQAKNPSRRHSL